MTNLKYLIVCYLKKNVNYLLDIDIKGFFDNLDQKWLTKMLKERVTDKTILRLIGKWLKVGVIEEGKRLGVSYSLCKLPINLISHKAVPGHQRKLQIG